MKDWGIKKVLIFGALWILLIPVTQAQTTLPIADYIEDRVEKLANLPEGSYTKTEFQTSWIDGMDFRTETDQFAFNRQRYLVRVSPNTPKVRRAQSNLHQLYLKKANLQRTLLTRDFVEFAYEEVLEYYALNREKLLKEKLLSILTDQRTVWQRLNLAEGKISKDWLTIQEDIRQLSTDLLTLENYLSNWIGNGKVPDYQGLISMGDILNGLTSTRFQKFQLQAMEYDVDNLIVEREEELEKAEQKKLLDFLQLEYNGPHTDPFEEKVSVTAAIRLPFSSGRQLKMEEIAIEKDMLQQERRMEKQLDQYKEKELLRHLETQLNEYEYLRQSLETDRQQYEKIAERSSEQVGGNPLFSLYQQEVFLKEELKLLELELDIYQAYLDLLRLTELLYQPDFFGFLSTDNSN